MNVLKNLRNCTVANVWLLLLLLLSRISRVRLCATQRLQPTRLRHPWGSPGKNTGVVCHFLLQCMQVKSESEVAQSCPTLRYPMGCRLPGSSRQEYWSGLPLPSPRSCYSEAQSQINSAHILAFISV